MNDLRKTALPILATVMLLGFARIQAQQSAPLTAPIVNAKKIFIANAGADALITASDRGAGDRYYTLFHAAMKNWGRYTPVDSPSEADLVLEIYASSPVTSVFNGTARLQPQMQLTIFDVKTHFLLWRITQSLEAGHPKLFGDVDGAEKLDRAIDVLVQRLKLLVPAQTDSGQPNTAK